MFTFHDRMRWMMYSAADTPTLSGLSCILMLSAFRFLVHTVHVEVDVTHLRTCRYTMWVLTAIEYRQRLAGRARPLRVGVPQE